MLVRQPTDNRGIAHGVWLQLERRVVPPSSRGLSARWRYTTSDTWRQLAIDDATSERWALAERLRVGLTHACSPNETGGVRLDHFDLQVHATSSAARGTGVLVVGILTAAIALVSAVLFVTKAGKEEGRPRGGAPVKRGHASQPTPGSTSTGVAATPLGAVERADLYTPAFDEEEGGDDNTLAGASVLTPIEGSLEISLMTVSTLVPITGNASAGPSRRASPADEQPSPTSSAPPSAPTAGAATAERMPYRDKQVGRVLVNSQSVELVLGGGQEEAAVEQRPPPRPAPRLIASQGGLALAKAASFFPALVAPSDSGYRQLRSEGNAASAVEFSRATHL